jgi:hypothetical protein
VFVRGCNLNFVRKETHLQLFPMHDTAIREDSFCELERMLEKCKFLLDRLVCLV